MVERVHIQQSGWSRLVRRLGEQTTVVFVAAFAVGLSALFIDSQVAALFVAVCAVSLASVALAIKVGGLTERRNLRALVRASGHTTLHDPYACYITDADGTILHRNHKACERPHLNDGAHLADCLADLSANPVVLMSQLSNAALADGAARNDLTTRRGVYRVSVQALGPRCLLWRVEDCVAPEGVAQPEQSTNLPMLSVSGAGAVLFMNAAMRELVGERAKSLDKIFTQLPLRNGHRNEVNTSAGKISCMVAELEGTAGRREVFLLPATVPDTDFAKDGWSFFDEVPVALLKVSSTGKIIASNRQARSLLGQPVRVGTEIFTLFDSLGRSVRDWVQEAVEGKNLGHPEFLQVVGSAQDDTFVQVTFNRVKEDNEIVLVAVLNDATELQSLQQQFVQSQKMQAIGQLAGGVAHDFNNLLTAISGHCDLLLLRHDANDQDYGDLIQISQNANRAAALVGQLLAFSRKQNLVPERLDVRDVLSNMGHLLNRLMGERVTLTQRHAVDLDHIRADKRQLEQVLMNLVVNAKDAMPNGGEIEITTEIATLTDATLQGRVAMPAGDYVAVKVTDEGVGIPNDKLSQIFEPFFTTKRPGEGTGLGLSTAYGIVKQTGGYIFADSEVGQGTTFTLFFPVATDQETTAQTQTGTTDAPEKPQVIDEKKDGVVLLVEDEAPVRAFASRALRLRGFTVLEADSAETALRTLSETDLNVDIFVTDVVMPGIDGPSWVAEALIDRPDTKVVFVSGYAKEAFADRQAKIPNSVFLPKPFSLNELTNVVQNALD